MDSSFSDYVGVDSDDDYSITHDKLKEQTFGEVGKEQRISSAIKDYNDGSLVFLEIDLEVWKQKEWALIQRYKDGYYRSKDKHAEVYEELLTLYSPYITEEALAMFEYLYSPQTNETMNKSISAFAPKCKHFLRAESLYTRVGIAAGIQILGCELFWESVFEEFGVKVADNLRKYLKRFQKKKDSKREKTGTKEGNAAEQK